MTVSPPELNPGADAPLGPGRSPRTPRQVATTALLADRWAVAGLLIVLVYLVLAAGVWAGLWATDWSEIGATRWAPPSPDAWFGTNLIGQDIFQRAVASSRTAFEVGLIVAAASTLLGAVLGGLAGYFAGTWVDALVLWMKGTLDAIPFYLLVAAIAFALQGNPWAMHIAMTATFWTTTGRLVRGEVLRLRHREFVDAARAIGLPDRIILARHILPNTLPVLLVQATITFVAAIKSEVILSFLGLGIQDGVSWGLMIAESTQDVLAGHYMNFIAASSFLFVLVMGFNLLADGLQDALDPQRGSSR
ncbi:ABC transporter permease [Halomonas denitrificans]|nr:ABC transporter permease [Halomonas denitrificans]